MSKTYFGPHMCIVRKGNSMFITNSLGPKRPGTKAVEQLQRARKQKVFSLFFLAYTGMHGATSFVLDSCLLVSWIHLSSMAWFYIFTSLVLTRRVSPLHLRVLLSKNSHIGMSNMSFFFVCFFLIKRLALTFWLKTASDSCSDIQGKFVPSSGNTFPGSLDPYLPFTLSWDSGSSWARCLKWMSCRTRFDDCLQWGRGLFLAL